MNIRLIDNRITLIILSGAVLISLVVYALYKNELQDSAILFYLNKNFLAIPLKYGYAKRFKGGLAPVRTNNKWGFIDKTDKFVIQPQFDGAKPFSEGMAAVMIGKKWGFINKKGKIIIKPQYDDALYFNDGMVPVLSGRTWDLIDQKGYIVEKSIAKAENFYGILPKIRLDSYNCNPITKWKVVFDCENNIYHTEYIDFYYIDKVNFICRNKTSGSLFELYIYSRYTKGKYPYYADHQRDWYTGYGFNDGYEMIEGYKKSGYIDKNKKCVIPPIFENADSFSEGYAAVKLNGKWGYISKERLEKYRQK